jgi:hypothetical protein
MEKIFGAEKLVYLAMAVKLYKAHTINILYNQLTAGYLVNPRNRLSLQADIVYRKHTSPDVSSNTFFFMLGIKTNIFNYYHDF